MNEFHNSKWLNLRSFAEKSCEKEVFLGAIRVLAFVNGQLATLMHSFSFINYDPLHLFKGSFTIVEDEIDRNIPCNAARNQ